MISIRAHASVVRGISLGLMLSAAMAQGDPVDWARARNLLRRHRSGEILSEEERAYLNRARAERATAPQAVSRPAPTERPADAERRPLTEVAADATYRGLTGGLYGEGRNNPPPELAAEAQRRALAIRPLDASGAPSPQGRIGLISIGMSNTTQEFSRFMELARSAAGRSPAVTLVDGAQGGQDATQWAASATYRSADRPSPWAVLDQRLARAGISPLQVQAVWIKQARRNPAVLGEFPRHSDALADDLVAIIRDLKQRFPNLQIAYLSSRTYAGWAVGNLNPEPFAYESAFAVRRVIERQRDGEPALDYRTGKAPLVLWGPYLWANGETPRADGFSYVRDDFARDGTHPSPSGRQKVAEQLLRFFSTDPSAKPWFIKPDAS